MCSLDDHAARSAQGWRRPPEGEDAIRRYREVMAESSVHGSGDGGAQEIAQFFSGNEILQ
jgi:hypothetical protein